MKVPRSVLTTTLPLWLSLVVVDLVDAQHPVRAGDQILRSNGGTGNGNNPNDPLDLDVPPVVVTDDSNDNDDSCLDQDMVNHDRDPQLRHIDDWNVDAYVRADISSFYREPPGSRVEQKPAFPGQAGKFVNMSPDFLDLCWESPQGECVLNDRIAPWHAGGTSTFPGHVFIFTQSGHPDQVVCRIKIVPGVSVYYCDPFADESTHADTDPRAAGIIVSGKRRLLSELTQQDRERYDFHVRNFAFAAAYKNFTGGSEWLSMYPRDPPRHPIWRADFFGQTHRVTTPHTQFHSIPKDADLHPLTADEMRTQTQTGEIAWPEYRDPGVMNITIKALSCAPRAFEVRDFLSDVEADHIMELVRSQYNLERSTTNGHLSETRTSTTTWVPRHSDAVVDAIFRRVADALRMNEALLRRRHPRDEKHLFPDLPSTTSINEDLQIVHYNVGQQYTAHHDFGYYKGHPQSPSRSINFCMYMKDVEEGGETSFPRWRNAETNEPINVKPEKGKAMIFYMINPDGNLDDLTQHAALPVVEGEKFFANLWIHDPFRF